MSTNSVKTVNHESKENQPQRAVTTIVSPKLMLYDVRAERLRPISENSFRLVTYNILADVFVHRNNFVNSPPGSVDYKYRLKLLESELKSFKTDILCLQEVGIKDHAYLRSFLTQHCGLTGDYVPAKKHQHEKVTVATFYNPSKFQFISSQSFLIQDEIKMLWDYKQISSSPEYKNKYSRLAHVFNLTLLEHKYTKRVLLIGNIHQYANPAVPGLKLLQTIVSIKCMERQFRIYRNKFPDKRLSVLFCGDFNAMPNSGCYEFITSGKIKSSCDDWKKNAFNLKGISEKHMLNLSTVFPNNEITTIKGWESDLEHFQGCIDYIFYQPESLTIEVAYPPLSKSEISDLYETEHEYVTLPNLFAPSDHMPLIVDFNIPI